jgi:predicted nucleic acid-binding protein
MKYYFDTSVWLAYLNKDEFFHKEAVMWFDKIKQENHELYTSDLVDKEMKGKPAFNEYRAISEKLCIRTTIGAEDRNYSKLLSRRYDLPASDIEHILHAKRNGFTAVSSDINHWPKIARLLGFQSFYYTPGIHSL